MRVTGSVRVLGAAVLLAVVTGCGPAWKVIKPGGSPSALKGATELGVTFDYSQLVVEGVPLQQFVADKKAADASYEKTWADLMGRFETAVVEGARSQFPGARAGPAKMTMVVRPTLFNMGKYIVVAATDSGVNANLVFQVDGQPTEEIAVKARYQASVVQPSVHQHMSPIGKQLGALGGRYMDSVQK